MRYLWFVLLWGYTALWAVDATLKIEKDVEQRSRIALIDGSALGNQTFFHILLSDFKISGHFLVDKIHHQGTFSSNYLLPLFQSREYVLKYTFSQEQGSHLGIRLLRVRDNKEVFHKSYTIPSRGKYPFLAHKAVSDINHFLHYQPIDWINRYVVFSRYTTPRKSEIVLADYTMTYQRVLIRGGLNLFPQWADKKQTSLYYTSYNEMLPTLYLLNIYNGRKEKVLSSEGMLVCSDVSADGSKLLLTMAPEGQADIYEWNRYTHQKRRLTHFHGIDVNGKYLAGEQQFIFVSNRLGSANIFKKALGGAGVSKAVYHGRNNNACDTYGNEIVYISRESNHAFKSNLFNLYYTTLSGAETKPLTSTGNNQFPRFSMDGSVVQFIKRRGASSSIGYINLKSHQSLLFPLSGKKIQSIDW